MPSEAPLTTTVLTFSSLQVLGLQHFNETSHSRLPVLQARALALNVAPRDPCPISPF